ncbi:conserved membrane hypothetical protein [Candidatus Desulfarcum epimagneticum]|uniref:Uncharacterized protein n=1 Tax=uncultured Desulfobacteraceae bacterium TaxID=218296 RepID=A0A484HIB2_9BACT|nr:conserved membrane hypothetical protein [uncultured Desulfobacteraceae bacterium]
MSIILAIVIGGLFGFVLERAGAADPEKIINMLRLKDLHLMKAILFGIGISSLALFSLMGAGVMGNSHLSVKASYVGVVAGGCLLGLGWSLSGFCPGTGLAAAGARRRDALFYILGGLVGAFLFTLSYGSLKSGFLFQKLFGGKATLAATGIDGYPALAGSIPGWMMAGGVALAFIVIACLLPLRPGDKA